MTNTPYPTTGLRTARDWHIYHVYSDPDFIEDISALKDLSGDKTERQIEVIKELIASDYFISVNDINIFLLKNHIYLTNVERKAVAGFNTETNKFTIEFDFDCTQAEVLEAWQGIINLRSPGNAPLDSKRRRAPDDTELIYSISKSRKANKSFPAIFDMYSTGTLPGYDSRKRSQYNTAEALKQFFYLYDPSKS